MQNEPKDTSRPVQYRMARVLMHTPRTTGLLVVCPHRTTDGDSSEDSPRQQRRQWQGPEGMRMRTQCGTCKRTFAMFRGEKPRSFHVGRTFDDIWTTEVGMIFTTTQPSLCDLGHRNSYHASLQITPHYSRRHRNRSEKHQQSQAV